MDYPFTLTGVLYFPHVSSNIELQRNHIQLYCNSVYVTDQVEGVVPEFMTLMQGVIDSPDIPLNVSRSYLQADTAVKKISAYISKKVAEKLAKMQSDDRKAFEARWPGIQIFIDYGMLTDAKFCDAAMKFYLLQDVEKQYFTLDEYKKLTEATQTDSSDTLIWLYATDPQAQYSYIEAAKAKGYNVLLMDGQLSAHIISMLESKLDKTRMVRVDSDNIDNLIVKTDTKKAELTPLQADVLSGMFRSQMPKIEKTEFMVTFSATGEEDAPAMITQNEFMRRMREMSAMQPAMAGLYGEMPSAYSLQLNTLNPAVRHIIELATSSLESRISPIRAQIVILNKEAEEERKNSEKEKEATTVATNPERDKKLADLRAEEEKIVADYAKEQPEVRQIIDLSLLRAGLLKGENLDAFIKACYSSLTK